MIRSKIRGIGHAVPDRVVTNADLEKLMETTDEWIVERSGIKEPVSYTHLTLPTKA